MHLNTSAAENIHAEIIASIRDFLADVNVGIGVDESPLIRKIRRHVRDAIEINDAAPDEFFNDLFVLERYIDFFECYGQVWKLIAQGHFSASWSKLQDAFDVMRLVRRFSRIDMEIFEDQLLELEKTYPYTVFFSIGALVEHFECSLCGKDIDSFECLHRKGQLYRGRMASAIARKIVSLNHIAMVDHPEDRRCVISYGDADEVFNIIRFLSKLLTDRKLQISEFGRLMFSTRRIPNPAYRQIGRNDLCYCGSNLKFKRCCIEKSYVESDHVDIVPHRIKPVLAVFE